MAKRNEFADVFVLGTDHGCLTGDCPHATSEECWDSLRNYIRELCSAGTELTEKIDDLIEELANRNDAQDAQ